MTTEDDTEANRATVIAAFEAWRDEGTPITTIFAPEMTWRIVDRSAASRAYPSKKQFVDEVLAPFERRFSIAEPFRPVEICRVYAYGATVVAHWKGRGTTLNGIVYENTYAWFMKLRDGQVVNGTAFYDNISLEELWKHG